MCSISTSNFSLLKVWLAVDVVIAAKGLINKEWDLVLLLDDVSDTVSWGTFNCLLEMMQEVAGLLECTWTLRHASMCALCSLKRKKNNDVTSFCHWFKLCLINFCLITSFHCNIFRKWFSTDDFRDETSSRPPFFSLLFQDFLFGISRCLVFA